MILLRATTDAFTRFDAQGFRLVMFFLSGRREKLKFAINLVVGVVVDLGRPRCNWTRWGTFQEGSAHVHSEIRRREGRADSRQGWILHGM